MTEKKKIKKFSDLVGVTVTKITVGEDKDAIDFFLEDGREFSLYHYQNCCESVTVEDICGDLTDIENSQILLAEEVVSEKNPDSTKEPDPYNSCTWTFYKLSTIKGSVTIRWYGESNGHYSESVSFGEKGKRPNW